MFLRGIFEAEALPVLEKVLAFSEQRHEVLAANVANAETPDWRRHDLPVAAFRCELERAVERRRQLPGRFEMRAVRLTPEVDRGPFVLRENQAGMLRHDRNNVDLDREMALLGRNALLHNTVASLLRDKYGVLKTAIAGGGTTE